MSNLSANEERRVHALHAAALVHQPDDGAWRSDETVIKTAQVFEKYIRSGDLVL